VCGGLLIGPPRILNDVKKLRVTLKSSSILFFLCSHLGFSRLSFRNTKRAFEALSASGKVGKYAKRRSRRSCNGRALSSAMLIFSNEPSAAMVMRNSR
jgi:hypothetical protein